MKYFIRKNMSYNTEYRLEQIFIKPILEEMFPNCDVKLEYPLPKLYDVLDVRARFCQPDIVIIPKTPENNSYLRIAIRMMGEVHESERQRLKDDDQRIILYGNGYIVFDFWKYEMPSVFGCVDMIKAKEEIKKKLLGILA